MMLKMFVFLLVCMTSITAIAEQPVHNSEEHEELRKYAESGLPRPAGWEEIRNSAELGSIFVVRMYPFIIKNCMENNESTAVEIAKLLEQYKSKHNGVIAAGEKLLDSGTTELSALVINNRLKRSRETIIGRFENPETNSAQLCSKFRSNLKQF